MFISPSSRIWLLVHISVQATSCIPTLSSEIRRRNSFIFRARLRTRTLSPRHLTVLSGAWPVKESRFLHLSTHRHFSLVDYRAWTTASVVCTKAFKMVVKFAAGCTVCEVDPASHTLLMVLRQNAQTDLFAAEPGLAEISL